jgi:hypothetical protein
MNEIILLFLGMVGIFSLIASVALLALGKVIDKYPVGDESSRERSISSPIESTRLAVILFWLLFAPGTWAIFNESKIVMIVGITTIAAICLFMFTALVFSFAVLSLMRKRRKFVETHILHTGPASAEADPPSHTPLPMPAPVIGKKFHPGIPSFMFDALLKKE